MGIASEQPQETWLDALQRESLDWRPPMTSLEWEAVKAHVADLPPDLRTLYQACNGTRLPAGIKLFPLRGATGEISTLRVSREPVPGFSAVGLWRFGRVGEKVHLFAVRKRKIHGRADGAPLPEWMKAVPDEAWIYGIRNEAGFQTRLFRSLAEMLERLLPGRFSAPVDSAPASPSVHSVEVDLSSSEDSVEVELDATDLEEVIEVDDAMLVESTPVPPPPPPSEAPTDKVPRAKKARKKRAPAKKKARRPAKRRRKARR